MNASDAIVVRARELIDQLIRENYTVEERVHVLVQAMIRVAGGRAKAPPAMSAIAMRRGLASVHELVFETPTEVCCSCSRKFATPLLWQRHRDVELRFA